MGDVVLGQEAVTLVLLFVILIEVTGEAVSGQVSSQTDYVLSSCCGDSRLIMVSMDHIVSSTSSKSCLVTCAARYDTIYTGFHGFYGSGFPIESEYSSVCQLVSCAYVFTYSFSNS